MWIDLIENPKNLPGDSGGFCLVTLASPVINDESDELEFVYQTHTACYFKGKFKIDGFVTDKIQDRIIAWMPYPSAYWSKKCEKELRNRYFAELSEYRKQWGLE